MTLMGHTFLLPPGGVPAEVFSLMDDLEHNRVGAVPRGLRLMLPPEPVYNDDGTPKVDDDGQPVVRDQFAELMGIRIPVDGYPSGRGLVTDELLIVWQQALGAYGETLGNSLPSQPSSAATDGDQQKQTSNGTTGSTPAASSTEVSHHAVS